MAQVLVANLKSAARGLAWVLGAALVWGACSSEAPVSRGPSHDGGGLEPQAPEEDAAPVVFDPCDFATDRAGCPCGVEGAEDGCAVYYTIHEGQPDEYVSCVIGNNVCEEGIWSECQGVRTIQLNPEDIPPNATFADVDAGAN